MSKVEFKSKLLFEVFKCEYGNSKYTKEYCYNHSGIYEVFTGTTIGSFGFIDTYDYDEPHLSFSTDGENAGTLTLIQNEKYSIGSHRGIFLPIIDNIDLEYCYFLLKDNFFSKVKRGNVPSVRWNQIKEIEIKLPFDEEGKLDISIQKEIARKYREVEQKKKILLKKAEILKTVKIDIPDFNNTNSKKIPLNYIIEHHNGKPLYTKEYCKNNIGKYPVFSANNKVPFAFLKSFDYNGEYLTYSKNGCAGFITILNGQFSINGDRCLIKLTEEYKEFDLQFLKYYLEPIFRKNKKGRVGIQETNEYTKLNSNMIKKLNIQVPIPIKADGSFDIDKQKEIANKFATVENIKKELYRQIMELTSIIVE